MVPAEPSLHRGGEGREGRLVQEPLLPHRPLQGGDFQLSFLRLCALGRPVFSLGLGFLTWEVG